MNSKIQKHLKYKFKENKLCTMCGQDMAVSHGQYEYFRGIRVHIELCSKCSAKVIKRYVDRLLDGTEHQLAIDELTKFGQK